MAAALVVVMGPGVAGAQPTSTNLPPCQDVGQACVIVEVVGANGQVGPVHITNASAVGDPNDGADVVNTAYPIPGSTPITVSVGTSVGQLIAEAGVSTSDVHFVEVDGPDGYGRHLLEPGEWQPASSGNPSPPVFYPSPSASDYMNFIRAPRRSDDDQRATGPDQGKLLSQQDGPLVVVVHTAGQSLDVTADAASVEGGDRTYTLSCERCGGLSPTWYLPDGTVTTQASPTFSFNSGVPAGSYLFAVSVEDNTDGSFGWGQTSVQIGTAPTASATPTTPGTGGTGHGHHGPTHGTSSQSANPHPGHGTGGSPTASPTASARPSPQPTGVPTLPPVLPTGQPSSSLYVPATDGPLSVPSSRTPMPTPTPTATASPTGAPAGSDVRGVLLTAGDRNAPSPGGQILDVPTPSSAAGPAVDPPFRVDPLIWLGLGGVVLLAAGAASESDRVRRRVRRWGRWGRWARIGG